MLFYKTVEYYKRPQEILTKIECQYKPTLMTENDLSFLCGMIKEFRPHKLVEVGVAYGGTTAVVANCLAQLKCSCEMHSVDILDGFRGDRTGAFFNKAKDFIDLRNISHTFHLGNVSPAFLEEIGQNIDFLILDTSHGLPGELLEFIIYLPYLSNNAVVVIHDVVNHFIWKENEGYEFATQLLFDTVVADKYLVKDEKRTNLYPNIAAFVINEETRKYVGNLFGALSMPWLYIPNDRQYRLYQECINKNYNKDYSEMLEISKELNALHHNRTYLKKREFIQLIMKKIFDNKVYIYGAGAIGSKCAKLMEAMHIKVCGFVVSDNQKIDKKDLKIYRLSEVSNEHKMFIIAVSESLKGDVKNELQKVGIDGYWEYDELLEIIEGYTNASKYYPDGNTRLSCVEWFNQ